MKFLDKIKKTAVPDASKSALNMAGTVGTALAANMKNDKGEALVPVSPKHHGWGLIAIGLVNDVLNPEPWSRSLIGGAKNYGALVATAQLTKNPNAYGLTPEACGLIAVTKDGKQTYGFGATADSKKTVDTSINWAEEAEKARQEAEANANNAEGNAALNGNDEKVIDFSELKGLLNQEQILHQIS
jgi:hypothetical protein